MGSASTCKPQSAKAVFKRNGELLQVNTDVPKNENGMGLYRQQSAADMPTYIFLSEAYEIRVKDERSLAMRRGCFFCVRHDSHGLQRSKPARPLLYFVADKVEEYARSAYK